MKGEQSITLPDGRKLGYQELGDPTGDPLFFFHGTPGSRLVFSDDDLLAQIPNIRLISPERPGYGISDPKPDRTLLDWAKDVEALANHLNIDRFSVIGESGGGPHVLAVAAGLPHRIDKAFVCCSPAPANFKGAVKGMSIGNKIGLFLNQYLPSVSAALIRNFAAGFLKDPEQFVEAMAKQSPLPDQAFMKEKAFQAALIRDYNEAYRQGSEGHVVDAQLSLTSTDWGFPLHDIKVPVYLWHGKEDTLVSENMALHLANEIANCKAYHISNAGHILLDRPDVVEQIQQLM